MSAPRRPSLFASLRLVAAYGARQIAWSRRTLVIILLILLPSILAAVVRSLAPPGSMENFFTQVLPSVTLWVAGIVALFFGASMVRDGLEDHTLGFLLTRPLGRRRVALGLYFGQLMVTLPLSVLGVLVSYGACFGGTEHLTESVRHHDMLVGLAGTIAMAVLVYGALFGLFGIYFKRPAIIGIIWLQLFDWGFGFMRGDPRRLTVSSYLEELLPEGFASRATSQAFTPTPIGVTQAMVVLSLILLVSLFLSTRIAARRDYIVSGDEE